MGLIKKIRVSYNSPIVLTFVLLCLGATILGIATQGKSTLQFFSVYSRSLADPSTYVSLFSHVLGHVDLAHFVNNAMMLLLVGPMLEEKYGSKSILELILATAFITGVVHCLVSPRTSLCGASGVAFAFIVLASFASVKQGEIPLSAVLVVILFLGNELYSGITVHDNVSNLTHIVGGFVGLAAGIALGEKGPRSGSAR